MDKVAKNMWPINGPDKLETIILRFLARNLDIIAEQGEPRISVTEDIKVSASCSSEGDEDGIDASVFDRIPCVDTEITTCYHLRSGVYLTESLCDRLLVALNEDTEELKEMTFEKLSIFANTMVAKLSRADLRSVADHSLEMGLKMISSQPIKELKMPCVWRCLPIIKNLDKLRVLRLEKEPVTNDVDAFIQVHPSSENGVENIHSAGSWVNCGSSSSLTEMDAYKLNCPNLRCLTLHNLLFQAIPTRDLSFNSMVVSSMLHSVQGLTYLSLNMCRVRLEELTCIGKLINLVHLNVSNIKINDFDTFISTVSSLHRLQHLDLSQGDEDLNPVMYPKGDCWLKDIMDALPSLVSLDISGTNLAGFEVKQPVCHRMGPTTNSFEEEDKCSIPGLEDRKLEFLGLYGCAYNACKRKCIPAKQVTGDADSHQVVLAVQRYVDNHFLLTRALNDLFSQFRFTSVHNHRQALEGVLAAMRMYPTDSSIQIAGSASLFYIAKGDHKQFITYQHKRDLVNLLLAAMHEHCFDQTMMRNASLTLCHLNLPCDVMFCYERLVKQLLDMLRYDYRDEFIHRLGIFLLNCLACQVDGKEKELVGRLGAIETMLQIISRKVRHDECDDMLEVAWSTLWNVTDETPSNCRKFLNKGGMQLFVSCLEKFKDKPDLLRNMMGLMGNIAEVDSLRKNLMTEEYVQIFSDLLQSESDGIEVSYNACGVLSHLCFDGPQAWTLKHPSRKSVIRHMKAAIGRWPLSSKRNINYRSFEPILRLVHHFETPIVQYWASWALCNLTSVSPDKYCRLLESGNGRKSLEKVLDNPGTQEHIRKLLRRTVNKMNRARRLGYNLDAGCCEEEDFEDQEDNMAAANIDDDDEEEQVEEEVKEEVEEEKVEEEEVEEEVVVEEVDMEQEDRGVLVADEAVAGNGGIDVSVEEVDNSGMQRDENYVAEADTDSVEEEEEEGQEEGERRGHDHMEM